MKVLLIHQERMCCKKIDMFYIDNKWSVDSLDLNGSEPKVNKGI